MRRNFDAGRLHFTTDLAACLGEVEVVFSAVGTPPREDGSADLSQVFEVARTFGRHIGRYTLLVTKSTVPVGTAERIRRIVAEELAARGAEVPVRRGVEPRISQGGCGRQGFHVARPRGGGRRERTRPATDGAALPSVPDKQLPRAVHGHRLGRNDQIRRQRHAGDAHLVHERHRQPLRPRGGRRRDGPQGHRFRRPHRQQIPLPRLRIRRFVLPERRAGTRLHSPRTRLHDAGRRGGGTGERSAERGARPQAPRTAGRRPAGDGASPYGASRSSPRRTTCARRRR